MNIMVTGGAGFQGSHLVESLLRDGHHVSVLNTPSEAARRNLRAVRDHAELDLVWGSIPDREIVEKTARGCEVVFHLAAHINVDTSLKAPREAVEVNAVGTANVLKATLDEKARLIHASTCEVYGTAQRLPMDEDHPLNPHSPYAAAKAAADRLVYAYHKSFGLDATIMRPFNTFGPRQKTGVGGAVIPLFIENAVAGKAPEINGSGDQTRDFLFVEDLVAAYRLVFDTTGLGGEVINFGSGVETSINEVAEAVLGSLHSPLRPVHRNVRPGEVSRFVAGIRKARELGWAPRVPFRAGVARTVDWFMGQRGTTPSAA
jgi:dTDP-glucose 4,6-dehydratase